MIGNNKGVSLWDLDKLRVLEQGGPSNYFEVFYTVGLEPKLSPNLNVIC